MAGRAISSVRQAWLGHNGAPMGRLALSCVCIVGLVITAPIQVFAQEMEPKAYSASPVGATFLVVAASRNTGSVVFDPTLPIRDVEANINGIAVGVGTTFGLFGKLTLVSAVLPYAWGDLSGLVGEDARSITRDGLADTRV